MRKKLGRLKKVFVSLICIVSILGQTLLVEAEDRPIPVEPVILELEGAPQLTNEGAIKGVPKYLVLGKEDGSSSTMETPFEGVLLEFPYLEVMKNEDPNPMLPSEFVLGNLEWEFKYEEWDLTQYPKLQLPTHPDYTLYVGDVSGLPTAARWGVKKLSDDPYSDYAMEHVVEYRNAEGTWVRASARRGFWAHPVGDVEWWGGAETENYGTIRWELNQTPEVENISPLINGTEPRDGVEINKNSSGTIDGIHVNREGKLGNAYDLSSGIDVVGAVTKEKLELSNETPIPVKRFQISHDMTGINHLIADGIYTAIGSGNVISTVVDYENDETTFRQNIVVSTTGKPEVNIYHAGTDILYQMEWMSNHESADEWRQMGLDIQASSTINGTYDLLSKIDGIEEKYSEVTKSSIQELVTNEKIYGWKSEDTTAEGIPVTSVAFMAGSRSVMLSAESDEKYMRFDSTIPAITEVEFANDKWEKVVGHDAHDGLSGLETESGGVFYKFVERGKTEQAHVPNDSSDWTSLESYKLPAKPGEYDLYVYAKDNATNRSKAILLNKQPIVVEELLAKVRMEKKVVGDEGNSQDVFLLQMKEDNVLLGSMPLKRNEMSSWLTLDMSIQAVRTIRVSEIVPMDYIRKYRIYVTDSEGKSTMLDEGEDKIPLEAGDELTITIENEFAHIGYFKGKDSVKNLFQRWH